MPGTQSSGTPRKSQANFKEGTVWGLYKGLVGIGSVGSVIGENSSYRETCGTRRRGPLCG